jgi:hypothetical protein
MDSIKAKHIRQDLQGHLDIGPSAKERYLVVGQKYPINPVNNKQLKIKSIQPLVPL